MTEDEELHERLLFAFREYYKANLIWKQKNTRKASVATRLWLSEIRTLCSRRRKVIQEWRHTTWEEKQGRSPRLNSDSKEDADNDDN